MIYFVLAIVCYYTIILLCNNIVPVSTDASQGSNGGAIAGGLIAVIVALVVLVLVVLVTVCWIKRRARTKANSYTMFE